MKKILIVMAIMTVLAGMAFANGGTEDDTMTIGFSVYDMQYGFFQDMERGTREMAEELGYEFILHDQKSDEALMVAGCQDLIVQGIDALIVSPVKPPAIGPVVEAAHEAGIPVILDDIGGGGSAYDAIVISDNFGGGALAGDYVIDQLASSGGSKEVAIIKVEPSAVYAIRRGEGFKDAVTNAGYTVVTELSGHSKPEEGYSIMQDIIVAYPEVQAVFAENDPMAAAAAQAAVDAGRDDILIVGFNGDGVALDAIKAGTMVATVQQIPYEMGKMTVVLADKAIKGEALDYDDEASREIYVPVNLITSDNIDQY